MAYIFSQEPQFDAPIDLQINRMSKLNSIKGLAIREDTFVRTLPEPLFI